MSGHERTADGGSEEEPSAADHATAAGRRTASAGSLRDVRDPQEVVSSETVYEGRIWDVRRDVVRLEGGEEVTRELIQHPGAVGVLALDDQQRVLLVRQYRHPVGHYLWEAPAGLLDVAGEDPWDAARRELKEEAHLEAADWHVLVDFFNSPGGSTEAFRCYLARGLSEPDGDRHEGEGEERDMPTTWLPLDEAVEAVLAGRLHNPTTVSGVLAAAAARVRSFEGLRPAGATWPERFPDPAETQDAEGAGSAGAGSGTSS